MSGQEPIINKEGGEGQEPNAAEKTFSQGYVSDLRKESAGYRTRVKELEAKVAQFEQEKMSDLERAQAASSAAQAERDALAAELKAERGRSAVIQKANKLEFDADLAVELIKPEFDAENNPIGVEEAVKSLMEKYPQLVKSKQAVKTGPSMNPSRPKEPNLTLADVKNKSPQWVNENWDRVKALMAEEG